MPASATRLDDCLSIRDGRLWMEECDTVELARRFGTPVYAVSEDQLRRNARRIGAAFAADWPEGEVALLPSLKANLSLALRRILNSEGLGCDTFGPGELHAALASGIDPALISVNGSVKDAALVTRAVEAGARVTLDSAAELDLVAAAAQAAGRTARIRLRLRPDYDDLVMLSDFDPSVTIRAGAHRYKPGIPLEQAADVARRALATPGVELVGLMAHLGRHSADPEVWRGWPGASPPRSRVSARSSRGGGRRSSTSAAATRRRAIRSGRGGAADRGHRRRAHLRPSRRPARRRHRRGRHPP